MDKALCPVWMCGYLTGPNLALMMCTVKSTFLGSYTLTWHIGRLLQPRCPHLDDGDVRLVAPS